MSRPVDESIGTSQRLDAALLERGLVSSRARAQAAIEIGNVTVNGVVCTRPSTKVSDTDKLEVVDPIPFVSRGGLKLDAALSKFKIDVTGLSCIDIGCSTGGFTDCLLQRGAAAVTGVDVGSRQVSPRIAGNSRVTIVENCNARDLRALKLDNSLDLAVIDVSFISITLILPSAVAVLKPNGSIVALIKPQFEVGRGGLDSGGIVRDEKRRRDALSAVVRSAAAIGLEMAARMESPICGGDGNIEYLVLFRRAG